MRTLAAPPSLLGAYARAGLGALPVVGKSGGEVPDLELALGGVDVDRTHLARYARVCGFGLREELPPTYPHILAFPLHMALMTDGSFPFGVIGMVHVTNRITQHRPVRTSETLDLRVRATEGEHPKGRLVLMTTEARVGDELVWDSESGFLRRGSPKTTSPKKGSDPSAGSDAYKREREAAAEPPAEAHWKVPGDVGRRYADVSGDRNPIHLHDLSARLFGFKRAIAHGMWTKARALAALQGRVASSFTVDVRFGKPLFIPAKVVFATEDGVFAVRDATSGTVHLHGKVT
jgi:acyl dehydratase